MITLTMNGKKVKAEEGATLLEVCRRLAISIPTLCYHPDLTPHGSCRLCTVEVSVNGRTQMVTACNYPVREGILVETHSEKVLRARRILVELLLARCPQVKVVQALAREWGVEKSSYKVENPENDCILCGLCVRTCNEIVGANAIGFSKRGTQKKIGTPFAIDSDQCVACGACEYICPTGAIQMEMNRIRNIKRSATGTQRYCRYMRLGLMDFMVCSNGFECWRCEVDQMMEDRFGTHPAFAVKPAKNNQPFQVSGFTFFPGILYSEEHVWAKPMDPFVRLGLDEMGSTLAIGADSIRFPPLGSAIKKKQVFVEIISDGKKARIISPLAGTVMALNNDVEEFPDLIWRDSYRRGWLMMIQPDNIEEVSELLSGHRAKEWFKKQAKDLATLFMKWTPSSFTKGKSLDGRLIREIVKHRWNKLKEILLG